VKKIEKERERSTMGDKVGGGDCEEEMKRGWGDSEETRAIGIYPKTRTRGVCASRIQINR